MPVPGNATKIYLDQGTDDPKQARAELAALVDAVNALIAHLGGSTITSTPLTIGQGLEAASNALQAKLNGDTLLRDATGLKVNAGTGPNQIVQLDANSKLPGVDGSQLMGIVVWEPGDIKLIGGSTVSAGWLLCNGAAVSRVAYADLFAAIGTAHGAGDGSTTFNVPDLRGRAPIGAGQGSGLTNRVLGQKGGTESEILTIAMLALHGHPWRQAGAVGNSGNTGGIASNEFGTMTNQGPFTGTPTSTLGQIIGGQGGGAAHPNMSPFSVVNFAIKT